MKRLFLILLTAALCLNPGAAAWAEESSTEAGGWVDLDKGPGVARWLDEHGNEADPPGKEEAPGPGSSVSMNLEEEQSGQKEEAGKEENTSNQEEEKAGNQEGTEGERTEQGGQEGTEEQGIEEGNQEDTVAEGAQEASFQSGEKSALEGRQLDPSRPMVALTFDDGPYAPVGNQIMNCLAQYGGKATFYVVGNRCNTYRDRTHGGCVES